jgi:hypothetical protein
MVHQGPQCTPVKVQQQAEIERVHGPRADREIVYTAVYQLSEQWVPPGACSSNLGRRSKCRSPTSRRPPVHPISGRSIATAEPTRVSVLPVRHVDYVAVVLKVPVDVPEHTELVVAKNILTTQGGS